MPGGADSRAPETSLRWAVLIYRGRCPLQFPNKRRSLETPGVRRQAPGVNVGSFTRFGVCRNRQEESPFCNNSVEVTEQQIPPYPETPIPRHRMDFASDLRSSDPPISSDVATASPPPNLPSRLDCVYFPVRGRADVDVPAKTWQHEWGQEFDGCPPVLEESSSHVPVLHQESVGLSRNRPQM